MSANIEAKQNELSQELMKQVPQNPDFQKVANELLSQNDINTPKGK
jgi:hypothetical protein